MLDDRLESQDYMKGCLFAGNDVPAELHWSRVSVADLK